MTTKNTNFSNPESLIYQNELLKLTVLGGIKLDGLDRMRSTLKIELQKSSVQPVRHNLDLYNDNQTEKLIRRAAEKLEIGTSVITVSLAELSIVTFVRRLLSKNTFKPILLMLTVRLNCSAHRSIHDLPQDIGDGIEQFF